LFAGDAARVEAQCLDQFAMLLGAELAVVGGQPGFAFTGACLPGAAQSIGEGGEGIDQVREFLGGLERCT
jgi:hypothetical protein